MKPVALCVSLFVAAVYVCGLLVFRHACRTAKAPRLRPPAGWTGGAALQALRTKLRQEEMRQQPWEARN
jgi:hypothetical protein